MHFVFTFIFSLDYKSFKGSDHISLILVSSTGLHILCLMCSTNTMHYLFGDTCTLSLELVSWWQGQWLMSIRNSSEDLSLQSGSFKTRRAFISHGCSCWNTVLHVRCSQALLRKLTSSLLSPWIWPTAFCCYSLAYWALFFSLSNHSPLDQVFIFVIPAWLDLSCLSWKHSGTMTATFSVLSSCQGFPRWELI